MSWLEHRIPPPIVLIVFGAVMWVLSRFDFPVALEPLPRIPVALGWVVTGVAFAVAGAREFRRASTTINPVQPDLATSLVTSGIFRYTRNPMYVGLTAILFGWAVFLAAPWTIFAPIFFALYITRFQIIPEERILAAKFGADYEAYLNKVRRWL
jgi:protein-S-isoprenylcysteine O-methyltransferase Ste14